MNRADTAEQGHLERPSDLVTITAWWRRLGADGFLVLPPPHRSRYTQSDGHADAAELGTGRTAPFSFAYWHWQSHQRAFDRAGALTGELLLHWGGDHAVVAAGLGAGPAGFRIENGGPEGAFRLDHVTHRDAAGLPDPGDPHGVRQFLDELDEPVDRRRLPFRYRPLSRVQADWLHDRLREEAEAPAPFVRALERREALTPAEAERLLGAWRTGHRGNPADWEAWPELLHALLRQEHHAAWERCDALGSAAAGVLAEVPSERGLARVREWVLAGEPETVAEWLALHQALREPDPVRAAAGLAAELAARGAPAAATRELAGALVNSVTAAWGRETDAHHETELLFHTLTAARCATDTRLPRELRVRTAELARDRVELLREAVLKPGGAVFAGVETAEVLAVVERFDEGAPASGPDLTAYEGALGDVWHRYRALTDADTRWLHEQVAAPGTALQGLGFCLELLLAHGQGTAADVDALLPRLGDLTKKYKTTYTEWRHPLVTLTCLALDLGHPAAARLLAWWNRARPVWKNDLRPLTRLGAPDEAGAAELWEFVASDAHDEGQLMTWVLVRARLDGEHPLRVADRLLGTPGLRDYVLHRVLLGVADPAQPLWHYSVDSRSRSWWQRAVEVAEHPDLSPAARAIGLETARRHCLIRYPDQLRPPPTEAEQAAARAWLDQHAAEV
ncbi:hypothetical protein ABZ929_13470 [Streptomyces physcomitrii]|uniref:hypothetical protein n=1 Tax=Streptomyces physcomitrii TaxID=2724184 RepID=UPI0033EC81E2